jgi:hypothetical protein
MSINFPNSPNLNDLVEIGGALYTWNGRAWVGYHVTDPNYWTETSAGIHTLSNVGIGTTNPTETLTVVGDARVTGILTVGTASITLDGSSNTITVGSGVTIDGSTGIIEATSLVVGGTTLTGTAVTSITAGSGISVDQSTGNVTISATGGGIGGEESYWTETSAGIHTLSNVGIGTTNPTSALTVKGNTSLETLNVSGISTLTTLSIGGTTGSDGQYLKSTGNGLTWENFTSLRSVYNYSATESQKEFTAAGINTGFVDVYLNGIRLDDVNYSIIGIGVSLNVGAFDGDEVTVIGFNTVNASAGGGIGGGTEGDVSGPGSSTDNAVTRFDGTTGKLIQNSLVTIGDDGAIVAPQAGSIIPFYFDDQAAFPSASTYHGAIAHSHADGGMFYAHGGVWVQLADASDISWVQTEAGIHTLSNVGIGTTNPTETLTVVGDARVTGILTIGTASITLDGNAEIINVGTGVTIDGSTGIITATSFVGALTGTATSTTNIPDLTGDIISVNNVTAIATGAIVNADINANAAIADTKLATITTAGKVSNSATTATNANTNSAIVARDGSGNFSAGTITATSFVGDGSQLTGIGTGSITGISTDSEQFSGQDPCFYLNYNNFYNTPENFWTDTNQNEVASGLSITGISTSYTFSTSRNVAGVSTNSLTVRGHLYYPTSSYIGPNVDVVVLYHSTIGSPNLTPLDAAQTFLNIATSSSQLNLRDKIIFSVAYPQDAVPDWVNEVKSPSEEFPEFDGTLEYSNFYLGDNITHAEAALLWVKEKLNSYLSSNGIEKSISRIYTFGHSQGAYLTHRLNTMHAVDGVISNAPGPIDLLTVCTFSESDSDSIFSCSKIKTGIGSTTTNPSAYDDISLKNFLSGTLSPALFTQALDDTTGDAFGSPQVENMQNIVQAGLNTCTENGPIEFIYYDTGGHASFVTNTNQQKDIRNFVNSGITGLYSFYNVGIGTTNPTSKLTVSGDVSISGVVTATSFSGSGANLTNLPASSITWQISSSGSTDYVFSGPGIVSGNTNDPILYLYRGFTYVFVNNTGSSHPFAIRESAGGSDYTPGVTGSQTGTQTFVVPMNAPSTLYYQCTIHSGMGNVINIV